MSNNKNRIAGHQLFLKWLILPLFFTLSACQQNHTVISGKTMGTHYQIKIVGNTNINQKLINNALTDFNNIFSTWQPNSELSRINQAPINQWLPISAPLAYVIKNAQTIHTQSQGYFDITLTPLSVLWGFQQKQTKKPPKPNTITNAVFGQKNFQLTKDNLKKTATITFDVSAIAKGYAVDYLADILNQAGHRNFLIDIGGEIKASGLNEKKQMWTVAIDSSDGQITQTVKLNNQAIATSGSYRNYYRWRGQNYHHIINAKTGAPSTSTLRSVSVIHKQTMLADAYATALMAMPLSAAYQLVEKQKLTAYFIVEQNGKNNAFWLKN